MHPTNCVFTYTIRQIRMWSPWGCAGNEWIKYFELVKWVNLLLDWPFVIWNNKSNYFLYQFLTNVHIANWLLKISVKNAEMLHWYFIWSIILPDIEQIMGLSETGRMTYCHKSKQQIVLLWPCFSLSTLHI